MKTQIKLKNRYINFKKALNQLKSLAESKSCDSLNDIEKDSLIKRFELTFELSWNVLKDYLSLQGETELYGSKKLSALLFSVES